MMRSVHVMALAAWVAGILVAPGPARGATAATQPGDSAGWTNPPASQPAPDQAPAGLAPQAATQDAGPRIPAFPGAGGYGMYARGGRGGDVYHVTNLNASGPGSLDYGIRTAKGPRTIVFDVGGTINGGVRIRGSDLTIAGQTAPGKGIVLNTYGSGINGADHVIVRHLRFRGGDLHMGEGDYTGDAFSIGNAHDIIVDHCSAVWGIDENLSCAGAFANVTVQYCVIAEGLAHTGLWHGQQNARFEPGGPKSHSMGSLIKPKSGDGAVTYHHNLWAMNGSRNPAIGGYSDSQSVWADIRNNVVYNCAGTGYSSGANKDLFLNYVGNYLIAGPATRNSQRDLAFACNPKNNITLYQQGNLIDADRNGRFDGRDTGWAMFGGTYRKADGPIPMPPVDTQTAQDALQSVLAGVGPIPWDRDAVDARIVGDVTAGEGKIIDSQSEVGGYVDLPLVEGPPDTDRDGMPDWWEKAHPGLDANTPDNNADPDGDGYTHLEDYLNYMATPPDQRPALAGAAN